MSLPWVPRFMTAAIEAAAEHESFTMTARHRFIAAGMSAEVAEWCVQSMCAEADERARTTMASWIEAHRDVYARMVAEL